MRRSAKNSYWPSPEQERRRRDQELEAKEVVQRVVRGSKTFGLKLVESASGKARREYAKPPFPKLVRSQGGSYTAVEVMRLLNRANADSLPYVERLMVRMLERQEEAEVKSRDALYTNFVGFNKPDSATALKLLAHLKRLKNRGTREQLIYVHYRMSKLLAKYANRQLLDIMNAGAAETGNRVLANRRAKRNSSRVYTTPEVMEILKRVDYNVDCPGCVQYALGQGPKSHLCTDETSHPEYISSMRLKDGWYAVLFSFDDDRFEYYQMGFSGPWDTEAAADYNGKVWARQRGVKFV